MLTLASLLALLATNANDSLMARGVSHELARYRAAHIRDVRYDLVLDVTRRDTVVGNARISFSRVNDGDAILDFRGYSISAVKVNGVEADVAEDGAQGTSLTFNGAHLRIPAARLQDGTNVVAMDFRSPIAPSGASVIRFTDETDKRDYLYTLLVPSDANLLFPCFDQPDLKAVFALELTVPRGWSALSNGSAIGGGRYAAEGDSSHLIPETPDRPARYRFSPTKPISTYLFAFAAGPYAQLRDARGDIRLWVRASRAREVEGDTLIALNRAAKTWLAQYFGVPYPFEKLDFLLAPAFPFGGMEHPGAIFYNEESFIYREPPTLNQRLGRQATVNHEIAHQWFGDYTTMKWFDDLWLKEGFATYMAAKMQAATRDSTAWMSFYLRNKPAAYDVDASAGTTSVWQELANLDQAKSNYGAIVYNKAPGILKQLNYLVGEAAFKKGVHDFLVSHAYGNGTWQELLASVGKAGGRDLVSWGQSYFVRPGMPIVEQQLTVGSNGRIQRLALVQRPAQSVSGKGVWPMKVDVRVQYAGTPIMLPVELTAETTVVAGAVGLPKPNFVYPNSGDYGYGLFMLDTLSTDWLLGNSVPVQDRFLRAMIWGSLWDLVRDARLMPALFVQEAVNALSTSARPRYKAIGSTLVRISADERDEQIASRLMGRVVRVVESYIPDVGRARGGEDTPLPRLRAARDVEERFLAAAKDSTRTYGMRKNFFDNYVAVSRSREALALLNAWLDSASAAGMPLRQPTRWSIVTTLITRGFSTAESRLTAETARDTTTGGKRRAFIAAAAFPRAETKRTYFDRYFADSALNEEWVTASVGAFNAADQDRLTLPFLRPALDTLPWIQKNRRIFFLGAWLNAFIGGQKSPEALAVVDQYLAEHPDLPKDLRQKVLQARDDLERSVRIRAAFGG